MRWTRPCEAPYHRCVFSRKIWRQDNANEEFSYAGRIALWLIPGLDTQSFIMEVTYGAELLDVKCNAASKGSRHQFERGGRGVGTSCGAWLIGRYFVRPYFCNESEPAFMADDDRW